MDLLKYIKFAALSITMLLTGCDDFLDVESPTSREVDEFYSSPLQAQQALLGVYNGLLAIPEYSTLMCEGRCDDVWTEPAEDKQRDYMDISLFNTSIYNASTINSCWNSLFKIVARANLFITKMDGLDWVSDGDIDIKTTFVAEARFLRALAYFDLVRYFGRVPISLMPMTADEAVTTPQSEDIEIYEKVIIPDLEYAISNLYEKAYDYRGNIASAGRANVIAAKALLGRVYLTMAGFPLYKSEKAVLAQSLFKEVIDYAEINKCYWANTSLDWAKMFTSEMDNQYFIFEVQYSADKNYGNPVPFLSVPNNLGEKYISISMSGNRNTADEGLETLYAMYPDDGRYKYTVDDNKHFFTKFFENITKLTELYSESKARTVIGQIIDRTYFPQNYPLIRLEDVMLMYAEISGPTPEAVEYVNRIRTRAGLPVLSKEELTADGFYTAVDSERRRELAFEGIRWHDIVRRNTYQQCVKAKFNRQACDKDGTLIRPRYLNYVSRVTPESYLYPIPDAQIKAKVGLYQQNPGY